MRWNLFQGFFFKKKLEQDKLNIQDETKLTTFINNVDLLNTTLFGRIYETLWNWSSQNCESVSVTYIIIKDGLPRGLT